MTTAGPDGSQIRLNCPLPQYYISGNGKLCETCEQSAWQRGRQRQPICLIAQANFYRVPLREAEEIAEAVLDYKRQITAFYYTEALKEKRGENGNSKRVTQNGQAAIHSG